MFVLLLLLLLLFSRSLPLSDWNTKLDSLSLVTGDTSYKSTFARVVRLEASCFLADGTPCNAASEVGQPGLLRTVSILGLWNWKREAYPD